MRFAEIELTVDGLPVVCRQGGDGPPLIHLPDAETPSPGPALTRLAERFRVIVIGSDAGDGSSHTSTGSAGPASRPWLPSPGLARIADALGLARYTVLGSGAGAALALEAALADVGRIDALVLESPRAAPESAAPAQGGSSPALGTRDAPASGRADSASPRRRAGRPR